MESSTSIPGLVWSRVTPSAIGYALLLFVSIIIIFDPLAGLLTELGCLALSGNGFSALAGFVTERRFMLLLKSVGLAAAVAAAGIGAEVLVATALWCRSRTVALGVILLFLALVPIPPLYSRPDLVIGTCPLQPVARSHWCCTPSSNRLGSQLLGQVHGAAPYRDLPLVHWSCLGRLESDRGCPHGAPLIVTLPSFGTLPIKIYNYLHYGAASEVAGLCLVMVTATVIHCIRAECHFCIVCHGTYPGSLHGPSCYVPGRT